MDQRRVLLVAALFAVGLAAARADDNDDDVVALYDRPGYEAAEYAWFDGLGFPDVKGAPLVRVAHASRPAELAFEHSPGKLLTTQLRELALAPTDRVERVDLEERTRERLVARRLFPGSRDNGRFSIATEDFFLARACVRDGKVELAHALFFEIRAERTWRRDLAEIVGERAFRAAGDREVTRLDAIAKLRSFVACLDEDATEAKDANRAIAALESRVAIARAKRPEPSADAPVEERARALAASLEDLSGFRPYARWTSMSDPPVDPGPGAFEDPKGPAFRLRALGASALPVLAEAFDDDTPTRQVHGTLVKRVGEAAREIAGAIMGQSEPTRDDVNAWLAKVREKGEATVLAERVLAEGTAAVTSEERWPACRRAASRLAVVDPRRALEAIRAVLALPVFQPFKSDLLAIAARIPGDGTTALLEEQLATPQRLDAIELLIARGRAPAIAMLLLEWERADGDERERAQALVQSGSAEAIRALGRGLALRSAEARVRVALACAWGGDPRFCFGRVDPERASLIEALLVSELESDARWDTGLGVDDESIAFPRVGDMAARALATLWPDRYRFSIHEPLESERDRARILAANVFRASLGKIPLRVPRAPEPPEPLAEAVVRPHLARLLAAKEEDEAAVVSGALALGLGALPRVEAALEQIAPTASPAMVKIARLAGRLSTIVSTAEVVSGDAPAPLARRLDALRGTPVTLQALEGLMKLDDLPGVGGLEVVAERGSGGAGVSVRVSILGPGEPPDAEIRRHFDDGSNDPPYVGSNEDLEQWLVGEPRKPASIRLLR